MGLINCQIDGGMFEEAFLASREIKEISIIGNDKPYFQGTSFLPLEFELTFAFENDYDERKIRDVARWLSPEYYKPFYTIDNPSRIFYCMLKGDSRLVHNGMKQGYITLTMRCDSPYSYTPFSIKENLKFQQNTVDFVFEEKEYNELMGTQVQIKIDNSNLTVNKANPIWLDYVNLKWSDLA